MEGDEKGVDLMDLETDPTFDTEKLKPVLAMY